MRETFPDRILDEADEVVLVDLSPEALQERLRGGQGLPARAGRGRRWRTSSALENLARAARARAARGRRGRRGAPAADRARPAQPAGGRASACSRWSSRSRSRSASCAAPGARRSGSAREIDALWVRPAGTTSRPPRRRRSSPRCGGWPSVLGIHFLEEEGDDLVATVRRVADERGSTYVFVGTPGRAAPRRDPPRLAALADGARAARHRHPRRRRPRAGERRETSSSRACRRRLVRSRRARRRRGAERILVPFTGGELDPAVLDAAIRIARAEDATLVPAYLLVAPLAVRRWTRRCRPGRGRDAAARGGRARRAAGRASPSTRASRRGRTPTHALQRLWEVERFDRIVAPAPAGGSPASRRRSSSGSSSTRPARRSSSGPTPPSPKACISPARSTPWPSPRRPSRRSSKQRRR